MGVPKFYKWISERYPCLSEVVKDYQIPEFDNLYLDMNGIIHNCSHPNDEDPHFRITEEQIFKDIFHYIEVLFRMIQPRKVFFMAIDGVAPRAKMNQQRGRRFRSAREAEENEKKAKDKGEVLPTEARFDSNCITPGTEFMTKLDAQLQYFVTSKISSDKLWQNCKVIYSGHKTPGEGEHKIMEYIRFSKSQPNFDQNTRHCLYGLDADLMMLGLTSHEPHFSLLREEVRFGGKNNTKRTTAPEETTFHLLHLSLMREYIEYEFYELHESLPFEFNLEAIIDDWVLMGFLVGNDFIPHLPGLHINKEALPILYETYKKTLPNLDGYLNEGGTLNLKRFEVFMEKLTEFDIDQFQEHNDNMKYLKGKKGEQKEIEERSNKLEAFDFEENVEDTAFEALEDCALSSLEVSARLARLGIEQDPTYANLSDNDDSETEDEETQFEAEFRQHKRHYYMTKMLIDEVTPAVLRDQVTHYIRGIQWILHYYYNGISSWSWYYPFHYAPYISDIKDFADIELTFDKGKPFLPFEQLLGVLPPLSVTLLPEAYAKLMLSENSSIIEYYPKQFSTDLNGKMQDWEAVVLIPFIDEKRLLEAMKLCNDSLLPDEKSRNSHGPMFIYSFTKDILGEYNAPEYFPPIRVNHADVQLIWREEWDMHPADFIKGLLPGAKLDVYFAGFPTLKHVDHTFRKEKESIKVFQQPSRGDSFILEVVKKEVPPLEEIANSILGKNVFVSWPHLIEAKVISVCSAKERYVLSSVGSPRLHENLDKPQKDYYDMQVEDLKTQLHNRWGIDIKESKVIIFAKPISGRSYVAGNDGNITLEKHWAELEQPFPYQTMVKDIAVHDPGYKQYKTVQEYFKKGSTVFMLGRPYYGCMGEVMEIDPEHKGRVRVSMISTVEPSFEELARDWQLYSQRYKTGGECASRLGISHHLFAKITGTLFMGAPLQLNPFQDKDTKNKLSIGLSLKNNRKNTEVIGYTRRCQDTRQWLYSDECIKTIREYQEKFPEIFYFLNKNGPNIDVFQDEVFPDNFKEKVPELIKWLKEAPFQKAEHCQCGSIFLDPSIVSKITDQIDKVTKLRAKIIKMQVKPHLLYKPNPLQGSTPPDSSVTFQMFDRIINTRDGFSIPLGLRGTIIGMQPAEKEADKIYDILFDHEFTGGLTLAGPSSAHRCYRLHWAAMINISHGDRPKAGENSSSTTNSATTGFFRSNVQQAQDYNSKRYNNSYASRNDSQLSNQRNGKSNKFSGPHVSKEYDMSNYSDVVESSNTRSNFSENVNITSKSNTEQLSSQSSGNSTKKSNELNNEPLLPPNPNQLPQPLNFKGMQSAVQHQEVLEQKNSPTRPTNHGSPSVTQGNVKGTSKEITNLSDVPFIMHGNFYVNLQTIVEKGLKDQRNGIPCVSYIPPKVGARTYQLHVYLDVKKLLANGIRMLLFSGGQVLCSTNAKPFLPPYYIERIFDTENECIIYPKPSLPPINYPLPMVNMFNNQNPSGKTLDGDVSGRGRGRVINGNGHTNAMQPTYKNIWSQMEDLNPQYPMIPNLPQACASNFNAKDSRKEVSISDLFQLASKNRELQPVPQGPSFPQFGAPNNQLNLSPSIPQISSPSPNKSQFIPTQVARNQTPRRHAPEVHNSTSKSSSKSKNEPSHYDAEQSSRSSDGSSSTPASVVNKAPKPKKKARCRLAANFEAFDPNNTT